MKRNPVAEGHGEDMTTGLSCELDPGNWMFLTPSPELEIYALLAFPELEAAQGYSCETVMW